MFDAGTDDNATITIMMATQDPCDPPSPLLRQIEQFLSQGNLIAVGPLEFGLIAMSKEQ